MKAFTLYVLLLEQGKYYVGSSSEFDNRVKRHFGGKGSSWTRKYKPLKVIEETSLGECSYRDAEIAENRKTIELMKVFGWENVRGGFFSNVDEHSLLGNLTAHSKDYKIDFIPVFKRKRKIPEETSVNRSSELSKDALMKRIQASAAAYFGNLYAHKSVETLLNLDCKAFYDHWYSNFQTRYGQIELDSNEVLGIFEKLKHQRIQKKKD